MLTLNGRVVLRRTRWHCPLDGAETPIDRWLDAAEATITRGFCELSSATGKQWVGELMSDYKHRGYQAASDQLWDWRKTLRGGKRKAADRLIHDAAERADIIRYPQFLAESWGKITSAISPIWSESETRHPPGSRPIYSHTFSSFFAPSRLCLSPH
ncbi:hypothetical protein [Lignipirellula cremea]|uniref:Uncharacterized protein n=1 Tax=Lignipirellula cremea TaxID=2528010 RepID=A0A518DKR3_9BACT|nr:hypothetical protein [Lignipirellula cremea]QDU92428.1 hypothetical protein Pla8534_01760 [Lignipirellula cremea]